MPCSLAISKLSGILISSGFIPRSPATSAFLVPCPFPVARNEPYKRISAFAIGSPMSFPAIYPIRTAPAVCELDGPTITGPIMSNISINHPSFQDFKKATAPYTEAMAPLLSLSLEYYSGSFL